MNTGTHSVQRCHPYFRESGGERRPAGRQQSFGSLVLVSAACCCHPKGDLAQPWVSVCCLGNTLDGLESFSAVGILGGPGQSSSGLVGGVRPQGGSVCRASGLSISFQMCAELEIVAPTEDKFLPSILSSHPFIGFLPCSGQRAGALGFQE